jgi:hypothetical protein
MKTYQIVCRCGEGKAVFAGDVAAVKQLKIDLENQGWTDVDLDKQTASFCNFCNLSDAFSQGLRELVAT